MGISAGAGLGLSEAAFLVPFQSNQLSLPCHFSPGEQIKADCFFLVTLSLSQKEKMWDLESDRFIAKF